MGNQSSIKKVNFEDIQNILHNKDNVLLINTLPNNKSDQECIIPTTINSMEEEEVINNFLNEQKIIKIIIYGKNCDDVNVYEKYNQLITLGFVNIFIYPGGMFEWMLLEEIYTNEHFPTTKKELDILKFKPKSGMVHEY